MSLVRVTNLISAGRAKRPLIFPWRLGAEYEEVAASEVLPGIDICELAGFVDRPTASQAIRAYRSALQVR